MEFIPDNESKIESVPFFEDVNQAAGWGGHTTRKGETELQSQIAAAIGRLGGMVSGWQRGTTYVNGQKRDAYRMFYTVQETNGNIIRGRMDVAALPVRTKVSSRGHEVKKQQSLRMALFNLRDQLESAWRMKQLLPGYFPLLPFMLDEGRDKTFQELWVERHELGNLLPEVTSASNEENDIITADFDEVND